jgi:putative oxidoreductase
MSLLGRDREYTCFVRCGSGLIAVSLIASALGKVSKWKDTIRLMQMHQVPWPTLGLIIAILVETTGGVCLLIGTLLYPTVIALFAYVVLVTAFIPLRDALKNQRRESAVPLIGSNIAILGGLVLVLALKGF